MISKIAEHEKVLIIIDMQERFLPVPSSFNSEEYVMARKAIISNILNRMGEYHDDGKQIATVSYELGGELITEVREAANDYGTANIVKYLDSLLDENQGHISKRIAHNLRSFGDCQFELVGVNATRCVLGSAKSMHSHGFDLRVNPKCILDCFPLNKHDGNALIRRNLLIQIKKLYEMQNIVFIEGGEERIINDIGALLDTEGFKDSYDKCLWEL